VGINGDKRLGAQTTATDKTPKQTDPQITAQTPTRRIIGALPDFAVVVRMRRFFDAVTGFNAKSEAVIVMQGR